MAPPVKITVHELALESAGPYRADLLAAAVEEELARLLASQGLPAELLHSHQVGRLDAGRLDIQGPGTTQSMGSAIARSIYRGIWMRGGT